MWICWSGRWKWKTLGEMACLMQGHSKVAIFWCIRFLCWVGTGKVPSGMEVYSILSLLPSSNDHVSFDHKYERLHEFVFGDFEANESSWLVFGTWRPCRSWVWQRFRWFSREQGQKNGPTGLSHSHCALDLLSIFCRMQERRAVSATSTGNGDSTELVNLSLLIWSAMVIWRVGPKQLFYDIYIQDEFLPKGMYNCLRCMLLWIVDSRDARYSFGGNTEKLATAITATTATFQLRLLSENAEVQE